MVPPEQVQVIAVLAFPVTVAENVWVARAPLVPIGRDGAAGVTELIAVAHVTVTVVVAVLVGSSTEVAVIVTLCALAGALQEFPDQVPAVLLQVTVPR
jgi:hypothetical protein